MLMGVYNQMNTNKIRQLGVPMVANAKNSTVRGTRFDLF